MNYLLFNGNFGYRDKSLNTNQFVGDFDVEYLLNRRGTWRLKAYNRYNDQNYYLRSAATTQGVGIMFKRDFDSLLSWLKPLRRKKDKSSSCLPTVLLSHLSCSNSNDLRLNAVAFSQPHGCRCVGGHAPVASRRKAHRTHLRAVGQA